MMKYLESPKILSSLYSDRMAENIGTSNLPATAYKAFEQLNVCSFTCFSDKECNKLHLCAQFLYSGRCQYSDGGGEGCRFGHDIKSHHNSSVLAGYGLDELTIEELRDRLKLMRKNLESVRTCDRYKEGKCNKSDTCLSLHICDRYLYASCDGQCNLSHDLLALNCSVILPFYGVRVTKENVNSILEDYHNLERCETFISRFRYDYKNIKKIGSGGFGDVFEAEHIIDKQKYAVKCIRFSNKDIEVKKREVEVMARLHHDNIVQYHTCWIEEVPFDEDEKSFSSSDRMESLGIDKPKAIRRDEWSFGFSDGMESLGIDKPKTICTDEDTNSPSIKESAVQIRCLCIQMELCQYVTDCDSLSGEAFEDLLLTEDKFKQPLMDLFSHIANAIAYLHSQDIIHRDLKPSNILLARGNGYKVKVGDFGLAKPVCSSTDLHHKNTVNVGTKSYMSPEMLNGDDYDKSTDIYSLGLIAVMICYPLTTKREWVEVLKSTRENGRPPLPHNNYKLLEQNHHILESMLKQDPQERPTAEEIKNAVNRMKENCSD